MACKQDIQMIILHISCNLCNSTSFLLEEDYCTQTARTTQGFEMGSDLLWVDLDTQCALLLLDGAAAALYTRLQRYWK